MVMKSMPRKLKDRRDGRFGQAESCAERELMWRVIWGGGRGEEDCRAVEYGS